MNPNNHKIQISKGALCFLLLLTVTINAQAIILYSGDNSINLTAPDNARIDVFNAICKISNENGSGIVGSAVHLKGKYLLTAEHVLYKEVTPRRSHISFDNNNFWAIDLDFKPIQIGNADLVIFKLIEDPNLPEKQLYSSNNELNKSGTIIGWGYGRDPSQETETGIIRTWNWGNYSTLAKRWGTNLIQDTGHATILNHTYNYFQTTLDSNQGSSEAGGANFDSGGGVFISNSGTWQLAGIITRVSTAGSSTFDVDSTEDSQIDYNYFVRLSQYRATINNTIPDISTYNGWAIDQSLYGAESEATSDPDGDGLNNQTEFNLGTNPNLSDTDGDAISDGEEINNYSTDPLDSDSDDDGLNDGDEIYTHNSEPLDADSDDDGLNDGIEVNNYGTNPNNNDSDTDGLSDLIEINTYNTNPINSDSDADGLSDSDETNTYLSNPNNADTSNDGFSDQILVDYGLNPNADHTLLYNAIVQSIADLRAGSTIIEVINNQAIITLNLESSDDLITWSETGDTATSQVVTNNNTKFYRFNLSD